MSATAEIHYTLSAPEPRSHYYHVRIDWSGDLGEDFVLALPVWTPGSYLIREYARHLINLTAVCGGQVVPIKPRDKASWVLNTHGITRLTVEYDVYAFELTVRTSYLDDEYGLVTPTSLFLYHPEWKGEPCALTVRLPDGWDLATALNQGPDGIYHAPNYDVLVDSPLQMGHLVRYVFEVGGVPHELVVAGPGSDRLPRPQFLDDLSRVVDTFHRLFGALPFERYVFLVTISDAGGGGLEHLNSTSIIVSTDQWQKPDPYARLLSIFAHEYFHLWNVKRLRPHVLGPFDYQAEVYTSLLWALEGLTDYFASWAMAQAGVISAQETLERFGSALAQYELLPGRLVTPVDRASLEAWIRQYRPEANTPNVTVSYYLKGALVGLFLDLELRRHSDNRVTLPRILKELWDAYGEKGYPEQAFEERLAQDGGPGVAQALAGYVHGLEAFDETVLEWVGLRLDRRFKAPPDERPVWTGMKLMERNGALMVQFVERGGPAEAASVSPDDEVIALNGERLRTLKRWEALLCRLESGQEANLITARRARVRFATVVPHPPRPDDYLILPLDNPTSAQRAAFAEWLGCPFPDQPDQR